MRICRIETTRIFTTSAYHHVRNFGISSCGCRIQHDRHCYVLEIKETNGLCQSTCHSSDVVRPLKGPFIGIYEGLLPTFFTQDLGGIRMVASNVEKDNWLPLLIRDGANYGISLTTSLPIVMNVSFFYTLRWGVSNVLVV